jgi:hypothetical protein
MSLSSPENHKKPQLPPLQALSRRLIHLLSTPSPRRMRPDVPAEIDVLLRDKRSCFPARSGRLRSEV